jgi:hypothetical protein
MDFYGLTLFTIHDNSGALLDIQGFFTAERPGGSDRAVYGFWKRKKPSKDPSKDKLIRDTVGVALNYTKSSSPGQLKKIGHMALNPVHPRVNWNSPSDFVPKRDKASAEIFIGKKDGAGFLVRVAIPSASIAVEVGFLGDPDPLPVTFYGETAFLRNKQDPLYQDLVSKLGEIGLI